MPTRSMRGSCPARLCLTQPMKAGSKQPGSSWSYPGKAGRQLHSLVPFRRERYSPPGVAGQSRIVAFLVINVGPARRASAILSASEAGNLLAGGWPRDLRAFSDVTATANVIAPRTNAIEIVGK